VDTLTQLMRREPEGWLVASSMGGNQYETWGGIKPGLPERREALHCGQIPGDSALMTAQTADNPLLAAWDAPFGAPPLDRIQPEHFAPAFERALAAHRIEIATIADAAAEPSFENTVEALERSGRLLAPGCRTSSTCWPARTPTTRSRRSSATWRRCWRGTGTRST
jgi:hypothetical protein